MQLLAVECFAAMAYFAKPLLRARMFCGHSRHSTPLADEIDGRLTAKTEHYYELISD